MWRSRDRKKNKTKDVDRKIIIYMNARKTERETERYRETGRQRGLKDTDLLFL